MNGNGYKVNQGRTLNEVIEDKLTEKYGEQRTNGAMYLVHQGWGKLQNFDETDGTILGDAKKLFANPYREI